MYLIFHCYRIGKSIQYLLVLWVTTPCDCLFQSPSLQFLEKSLEINYNNVLFKQNQEKVTRVTFLHYDFQREFVAKFFLS